MMKSIVTGTILLLCAVGAPAEQMYKWVDENGNVQFSNKPPPEQVKAETMEIQKAPAQDSAPAPKPEATGDNAAPTDAAPAAEGQGDAAAEDPAQSPNCKLAEQRYTILLNNTDLAITGADGKTRKLSAAEREQELAKTAKDKEYFCTPATPAATPAAGTTP